MFSCAYTSYKDCTLYLYLMDLFVYILWRANNIILSASHRKKRGLLIKIIMIIIMSKRRKQQKGKEAYRMQAVNRIVLSDHDIETRCTDDSSKSWFCFQNLRDRNLCGVIILLEFFSTLVYLQKIEGKQKKNIKKIPAGHNKHIVHSNKVRETPPRRKPTT